MLLGSVYLQIVMRTDDNILFRFEIPVNDAMLMQMTESQGQLCQVELHIFFSKHHLHDICVTYNTLHITVSRTFHPHSHHPITSASYYSGTISNNYSHH